MTTQQPNNSTTPSAEALPDDVVLSVCNVFKKWLLPRTVLEQLWFWGRNLKRSTCHGVVQRRRMGYGIKDLACNLVGVKQDARDVSFELRRGECLDLNGANG